jgi:hypothetical protein
MAGYEHERRHLLLPGFSLYSRRIVKHAVEICVITLVGSSCALGQTSAASAKWIGAWELDVQRSTFGTILLPGAPVGFKVLSQTLKIDQAAHGIRSSGDTAFSDNSGTHSGHDDNTLSFDGKETVVGPASFSFKGIDESTFDIMSKLNVRSINIEEVSHFAFSSDGKILTETKTQTERGWHRSKQDRCN